MANSRIPESLRHYKWLDYHPHIIEGKKVNDESVIRSRKEAKFQCREYAIKLIDHYKNIKENPEEEYKKFPSLIIYGPETSGKTVIATLVARSIAEKCEKSILFVDFMDLNSIVYTILDFRSETFTMTLEKYMDPDILIIDEVVKSKMAPMLEPFLSSLIRQRQNSDKTKITIITSKVSPDGIENIVGEDCARIIKKEREFTNVEILAERPNRLETFDENIYNASLINKYLYSNFISKYPKDACIEMTETEVKQMLNSAFISGSKRKKRK
jgi:DNA replication protein DnaC